MRFHKFSIFTVLVSRVYAHGYVDNVTVAGVFYEVSNRYAILNKAEALIALLLGIPAIYWSLLQSHSRSYYPTSSRQRSYTRFDIDRPPVRWLHSRWHLRVFSSKVDGRSSCGRKRCEFAVDALARQPSRTSNHIHGEVCKWWLYNIPSRDKVSYL